LVDFAVFYDVATDTVFDINADGFTNITFTDSGRGQFLSTLSPMRHSWVSGDRVEGLVARREAIRLIREHFPGVLRLSDGTGNFDISAYQTSNGGIAVLPYGDADLQTTIWLMPFILDDVNRITLRDYLQTRSQENRMLTLYGLAMLGEPVLIELTNAAKLDSLSLRDTVYVALGLAALGETDASRELYEARIRPQIVHIAPFYRVETEGTRTEILEATSVTALLAAKLGMPESAGLHEYAVRNRTASPLMNIERLSFIAHEINNASAEQATVTYRLFGEETTHRLGHGGQFTLRIPVGDMHAFELIGVTGDVSAVSIIRVPLEDMTGNAGDDIGITREFFRTGSDTPETEFNQDDLIRVQITVDYTRRAMTGTYVITDFLPAGLSYVRDSARTDDGDLLQGMRRAWVTAEGQRVTFFDHNGRFDDIRTYFYYARVITPGTFRAEGTIVQSIGAREYMAVGESTILRILP